MQTTRPSNLLRSLEFLLILGVAFALPTLGSLYTLYTGKLIYSGQEGSLLALTSLVHEFLALAVLAYVLFRQERSLRHIGLAFVWQDIPRSIAIAIGGYAAFYVCSVAIYYGYFILTAEVLRQANPASYFQTGITIETLLLVLVTPFFEELIVRAYTISELSSLTGSGIMAIASSVVLQVLYHLYQGVPAVLGLVALFLVFSLYYYKTQRVMPIILAHLYFDVVALLAYAH